MTCLGRGSVTSIIGRKIQLFQKESVSSRVRKVSVCGDVSPKQDKEDPNDETQDSDGPMLCLLKDFEQAIDESYEPQKPFECSHEHDHPNDCRIDDLFEEYVSPT